VDLVVEKRREGLELFLLYLRYCRQNSELLGFCISHLLLMVDK